jgi:hypothetical protein
MLTISYSRQFVNTEEQKKGGHKTRLKKLLTFLLRIALLYLVINFLKRGCRDENDLLINKYFKLELLVALPEREVYPPPLVVSQECNKKPWINFLTYPRLFFF